MAQSRYERGVAGQQNDHQRYMFPGYTFELGTLKFIFKAALYWGWLEITEGWRTWFSSPKQSGEMKEKSSTMPAPAKEVVAQTTVL